MIKVLKILLAQSVSFLLFGCIGNNVKNINKPKKGATLESNSKNLEEETGTKFTVGERGDVEDIKENKSNASDNLSESVVVVKNDETLSQNGKVVFSNLSVKKINYDDNLLVSGTVENKTTFEITSLPVNVLIGLKSGKVIEEFGYIVNPSSKNVIKPNESLNFEIGIESSFDPSEVDFVELKDFYLSH